MISLPEKIALNKMSALLYDFLPGQAHPFADQSISFAGIANDLQLQNFWIGGSKKPAILALLENTYCLRKERFSRLIVEIVNRAINYREGKNSIKRSEINELNQILLSLKVKIPELCAEDFLSLLPSDLVKEQTNNDRIPWEQLIDEFKKLIPLPSQKRGYEFEKFLVRVFSNFGLNPNSPFKIIGEQIDGSFEMEGNIYLIEAKWQDNLTQEKDLLILRGKLDGKAVWSRGVFISYSGFTDEGLIAFAKGKQTNMVGIIGEEIHYILNERIPLNEVIKAKVRRAAETGDFYTHIRELGIKQTSIKT